MAPNEANSFEVDGEHYLAVVNDANSSTLYHWDGTGFVVRQTVDTTGGARSWEFMQVGNQTYLVIQAHYNDNGGFNALSTVYKFH